MLEDSQRGPTGESLEAAGERRKPAGGWSAGRAGMWLFALASLMLLALASLMTWRWVDRNLLHWGVEDKPAQTVSHTELLERVRAFELATIKHSYAGQAHVEIDKVFNAGPQRVALPDWLAGQEMDAKGQVRVTAGVDLSRIRPEDMEVTQQGRDTHVIIRVPAPEVLSTELLPGTLDISTRAGLITRVRQGAGLSEQDLRDRGADEVMRVAKETAVQQGILDEAARETERRLQAFLQSLPQTGGRVTYTIVVREPAAQ